MSSFTRTFGIGHKTLWLLGAALLIIVMLIDFPRIVGLGFRNLALLSLSDALVTDQSQALSQAESYAQRAIQEDPHLAGRLAYRLGVAKQAMALTDEAIPYFQDALESNSLP